jgi:phage/conjugal plasmid C-4 type zinc finger TraR family protein
MADDMDRAVEISASWTNAAISQSQEALAQDGRLTCEDCGEEIPALRRAKHPSARRCVPCQGKLENRHRAR